MIANVRRRATSWTRSPGCEWPGLLTAMTVPRRAYPLSVQACVPVAEARDSGAPELRGGRRDALSWPPRLVYSPASMTDDDLPFTSIADLARRIRRGELGPVALTERLLDR